MNESLLETSVEAEGFPGQYLARAREAQGLSQEYVAGKLHLRTQVVQLLEKDAYDELPQAVFIQGYYRAYAKLLGLDPLRVLEQYNQLKGPETKIERILRQRDKEPRLRVAHVIWILVSVAILLLMGAFLWWNHEQTPSTSTPAHYSQNNVQPAGTEGAVNSDLSQLDLGLALPAEASAVERHNG